MSIEIVLVPIAVAAVSAWKARRVETHERPGEGQSDQTQVAVSTRMKNPDLLVLALRDLRAEVRTTPTSIEAAWGTVQARFARDEAGVWTAHFGGQATAETASGVVRDLDRAYGLRVQQAVLNRVRARAPQAGMAVESETVEEDRTVTLVLNVGR